MASASNTYEEGEFLNAKLISIKVAHSWVREVDNQLDALVLKASANPGMDFSKGIAGLIHSNSQLNSVLRESAIPEGHPLRKTAREITSRIIDLTATEKVESTGREDKCKPGGRPAFLEAYKMPKIDLPKFNGTLERWNHFWIEFEESVHTNETHPNTKVELLKAMCGVTICESVVAAWDKGSWGL